MPVFLKRKVSVPAEMPGYLFLIFNPADTTSLVLRLCYEGFFIPADCHSDLVTNPGHTLRALIKQFAFFLPLFHLIERLQSLSMRLKDYI